MNMKKYEKLKKEYGTLLNDWSEELVIDGKKKLIYYTKQQKEELFKNFREQNWKEEELDDLSWYMERHILEKEEYFSTEREYEFKGGVEWETLEEWFEDVEYEFVEVA